MHKMLYSVFFCAGHGVIEWLIDVSLATHQVTNTSEAYVLDLCITAKGMLVLKVDI